MLFKDIEYLKLTFLILTKLSHNFKLVNNVKHIFMRKFENEVIDKRNLILIDMIRRVIKGIDMGIRDPDALFKYSISTITQDVKDLESRLHNEMLPSLMNSVVEYLSCYPLVEPIYKMKDELIDGISNLEISGMAKTVENYQAFKNSIEKASNHINTVSASKITEEVLVDDSDIDIGLSKLARDRRIENTFTLHTFPAMDKLFSGGLRGRKTYLVPGNTGDFKSGLMLNIAMYVKNNPANIIDPDFLNGKRPLVLYITHENTLTQTSTRILKWYGYDNKYIDNLTDYEYQKLVKDCLKPNKDNGICFAMRYYSIGEISVTDIKNILLEYETAGFKVILLIEDYTKHVTVQLTPEEISDNKMTDEKKAEMLSAISRELFTPILTACQYNRNGQIAYQDARHKAGKPDYLKVLHMGYIGGSYNQTLTYESIITVSRGKVPNSKDEFLALYSLKDRDSSAVDNDDTKENESYLVFPFHDSVGFRISDIKHYNSVSDLNPVKGELVDVFKVYNTEQEEKKRHQDAVEAGKKYLLQNGFEEDEIDNFSDTDIIAKACHLSEARSA